VCSTISSALFISILTASRWAIVFETTTKFDLM
jgi:hypothetical protein